MVEYLLVVVLLVILVLGVVQAALVVHARNVAAATAADAARYAAASGRSPSDAGPYAVAALHDALGAAYADRFRCTSGQQDLAAAGLLAPVAEVRVDCTGRLPLRVFGVGDLDVHVVGHALREGP